MYHHALPSTTKPSSDATNVKSTTVSRKDHCGTLKHKKCGGGPKPPCGIDPPPPPSPPHPTSTEVNTRTHKGWLLFLLCFALTSFHFIGFCYS